ncbi:exodeoxyribonuclease VII small subunit [Limnohabitans sp.]|jgi:exodeoxyribonuclease VII small subunit|uniref:exodeoxyribonuclease VII small subunit n=1 Tax=Limnohabitans sp. TaxID=1907725 RepID=UPI0038F015FA
MPKTATPSSAAQSDPPLPRTFEEAQRELEALVVQFESGQMPLEELLAGYQRASRLLAFCKERLQAVESQIQMLDSQTVQNGNPS